MEKNNKILKIGLILIGMTLVICSCLLYYIKLEKPVFLEHYYEKAVQMIKDEESNNYSAQVQFNLQYITNTTDKRNVSYVVFKEAPEITFNTNTFTSGYVYSMNNNTSYDSGRNYGRYSMREVFLSVVLYDVENIEDELQLSQASIYFDNGDVMEANIGEIFLYGYELTSGILESLSSSSSNDGSSNTRYAVQKDITLLEINSHFLYKLDSSIQLKVGEQEYTDITGTEYKKGKALQVLLTLKEQDEVLNKFTIYDMTPRMYYKDENGEIYVEPIYDINIAPYNNYNFFNILKYLKTREVN